MSTKEIKNIDVISTAKIITIIYFLVLLVIFIPLGFIGLLFNAGDYFFFGSIFTMFFIPIVYGILTFLITAAFCFLYNLFAERIGGIKLELGDDEIEAM